MSSVFFHLTRKEQMIRQSKKTIGLLRGWKQIDIETTEAANEAKDNLKYLSTLQRFIELIYTTRKRGWPIC